VWKEESWIQVSIGIGSSQGKVGRQMDLSLIMWGQIYNMPYTTI
jgi:hypothetical protein